MSLTGVISVKGATCRVRRPTQTTGAANATQRTYTDAPTPRVKLLLEELTSIKAQQIWGLETQATVRATADATADVRKLDGIVVESGKLTGRRYRVVESPQGSELGPQLTLYGLVQVQAGEKFDL